MLPLVRRVVRDILMSREALARLQPEKASRGRPRSAGTSAAVAFFRAVPDLPVLPRLDRGRIFFILSRASAENLNYVFIVEGDGARHPDPNRKAPPNAVLDKGKPVVRRGRK